MPKSLSTGEADRRRLCSFATSAKRHCFDSQPRRVAMRVLSRLQPACRLVCHAENAQSASHVNGSSAQKPSNHAVTAVSGSSHMQLPSQRRSPASRCNFCQFVGGHWAAGSRWLISASQCAGVAIGASAWLPRSCCCCGCRLAAISTDSARRLKRRCSQVSCSCQAWMRRLGMELRIRVRSPRLMVRRRPRSPSAKP